MVYIAVNRVPVNTSIAHTVKQLAKAIKGDFEALNFGSTKGGMKTCFIKISDKLDPYQVVNSIHRSTNFGAAVTKNVPNLPPVKKKNSKIPMKTRLALRIPIELPPDKVFVQTHIEILTEMQLKYTGLFNLSKKTGHKLLEEISRTLFDRLRQVSESNPEALDTGFLLSKAYRKLHPHFGDFQLILSTLHRLQDAAAAPRTQIAENDLISVPVQPFVIENVPLDKVKSACSKYSDRISKKIAEHLNNLKTEIGSEDSEEDIARKKVREELKKMTQYMPMIIKEVISNHFIPRKGPFHRMRMYGEPFLPGKEALAPVVKRHQAVSIKRSDRMYNMLRFSIPLPQYTAVMAMDGTVIGGAKLVIRSSDAPVYVVPTRMIAEMRALFGVEHTEDDQLNLAELDEEPETQAEEEMEL